MNSSHRVWLTSREFMKIKKKTWAHYASCSFALGWQKKSLFAAVESSANIIHERIRFFVHGMRHMNTTVCANTHTHKTYATTHYLTRIDVAHVCTVYCSDLQDMHGNTILFHLDINLSQFSRQDTMTSAPSLQEITAGAQWISFIIHTGRTAFYSPQQRLIEPT